MEGKSVTSRARWPATLGRALWVTGLVLAVGFVGSAWFWVGYCSKSWVADIGDGTLYVDSVTDSEWSRPLYGWSAGRNRTFLPGGGERAWTWTWWAWGKPAQSWDRTAFSIWWLSPVLIVSGITLQWPAWRARRRSRRNQCESCGYDLSGSAGRLCPECGRGDAQR